MEPALEEQYYHELDRGRRKSLLEQAAAGEGNTPELKLRQKIWELRYIPRGKDSGSVDYYIRGWMGMTYLRQSSRSGFGLRRNEKEIRKIREDWNMEFLLSQGGLGERILYQELYNMIRLYLHLCMTDRTYGSTIFGLMHLDQQKLLRKIAQDVYSVAFDLPARLQMDQEFRILRLAAADAFGDQYPDQRSLLEQAGE